MSKELFQGAGWEIRQETAMLPDGRSKTVARAYTSDSVTILAFPSEKSVLVLCEYRPFYNGYVWMLPSGKVDKGRTMPWRRAGNCGRKQALMQGLWNRSSLSGTVSALGTRYMCTLPGIYTTPLLPRTKPSSLKFMSCHWSRRWRSCSRASRFTARVRLRCSVISMNIDGSNIHTTSTLCP